MEVIRNNKGGKRLCVDGHMYNVRKQYKQTITWMCCRRKSLKCKGTVSTDIEVTKSQSKIPHTHEPDPVRVEAAKAYAKMKEMAMVSDAGPSQIMKQSVDPEKLELLMKFGKKDTVLRTIRNIKRRGRDRRSSLMEWISTARKVGLVKNDMFRKSLQEALRDNNMHEEATMMESANEDNINSEKPSENVDDSDSQIDVESTDSFITCIIDNLKRESIIDVESSETKSKRLRSTNDNTDSQVFVDVEKNDEDSPGTSQEEVFQVFNTSSKSMIGTTKNRDDANDFFHPSIKRNEIESIVGIDTSLENICS